MYVMDIFFTFLEADNLCQRLAGKINSGHHIKLAIAHMPLLLICLDVS